MRRRLVFRFTLAIVQCILIAAISHAQYFQQHVDYSISVQLDTKQHALHGQWEMFYTNNSPDTLYQVYLHLYPNAYRSRATAFARQQLRLGVTDFHFADLEDRGGIDSLNFLVDGRSIPWNLDPKNPDIALLTLRYPLLPGAEIHVSTPFHVDIPAAFSRLGHIGDSYQITQWFPKPAVYDQSGWHPLPYLSQGEYYGEFGSFDIQITLPENYIVAATGTLISQDAREWLDTLALEHNPPLAASPPSSPKTRTWHFFADDVHDFAWFADKRFAVRKAVATLEERSVTCWAFFTTVESSLWERAPGYLREAIEFYSAEVGEYPYPQVTAVQVPDGSDFGMEYPTITSINRTGSARALDDVLAHEVGHNWFYGILGFNERRHPWMDEGINTFYEHAYLRKHYGRWSDPFMLWKPPPADELTDEQRMQQEFTAAGRLSAPDTDPEYVSDMQSYFGSYFKPALAFRMLQEYFGGDKFRTTMQGFYQDWMFRHPGPDDLESHFSAACDCDLSWLFKGLLGTGNLIDYSIRDVSLTAVTVENRGSIIAPVQLIAYRDTQILHEQWFPGFEGTEILHFDVSGADRVQIYKHVYTLDGNTWDNIKRLRNGKGEASKLQIRMFGGKRDAQINYLNILPVPAWNDVDKTMVGLALSNTYWPAGRLQWGVVPLYSFKTESFNGAADIRYRPHLAIGDWHLQLGLGGKSFHFAQDTHYAFTDRYLKIAPEISLHKQALGPSDAPRHELGYRYVAVRQWYGRGIDYDAYVWERRSRTYSIHELTYRRSQERNLWSNTVAATTHAGRGFVRLAVDMEHSVIYNRQNRSVDFHLFAGALPYVDDPDANVALQFNGIQSTGFFSRDYMYDELLFARSASSGLVSQFVFPKDAQLKTLYNGGISERWMLSGGVMLETPLPLPVRPYFDLALFHDPFDDKSRVSYSGGLAVVVRKDILEFYIPLVESSDIRNSLTYIDRDNLWKRISIMVNLKALHPFGFKGY